jgi:hypothetical protein
MSNEDAVDAALANLAKALDTEVVHHRFGDPGNLYPHDLVAIEGRYTAGGGTLTVLHERAGRRHKTYRLRKNGTFNIEAILAYVRACVALEAEEDKSRIRR